jgi:hypothetical protein
MRKKIIIENCVEIPEDIVIAAWEAVDCDEESGFGKVIRASLEYKSANMTPVFILNQYTMEIYCVAKETFGKKLH